MLRWAKPYIHTSPELVAEKMCHSSTVSLYVTTYNTITNLIRNGAGIGLLSSWFADNDPKLKRISPNIKEEYMDVWLLTHPDLRGVKRIKAITDMIVELFELNVDQHRDN